MTTPRFIPVRGRAGSVCIRDTMRNRLVCIFERDWQTYGYRTERADAAAVLMSETCAEALNRKYEESRAKSPMEGAQ